MNDRPVRVLLIEDDKDDYFLTRDFLADVSGQSFRLDWAADYDSGLAALKRCEHDVCLLDYRLGAHNGLDLLREAKCGKVTTILLTGQADAELDRAAMVAGIADFLEKSRLTSAALERSIRYALQQKRYADELERRVEERTAELANANAALEDADRSKDRFLATLSHELRNPLAPLRSGLDIMRLAEGDKPTVTRARMMMERQVEQMVRLIDDLLDMSRIATDKLELRRERVELAAIVDTAVETSRPLIEAHAHELTVTLPSQPIYLNADLTRLAQVFLNLLNNAAKYMERGGHIWLTAECHGIDVVVAVSDTGIGIPEEMLPHVFEMFTQVDQSAERAAGGLGIGLTLVRRIVELHGGRVEARSEGLGRGSKFVVRLPIMLAAVGEEPPDHEERQTSTRRHVLVVDDNRDAADSLAMMLEVMGNETRTAYDGLEAVAAAEAYRPEIVLLDLGLPRLDGYAVARHIRQQSWGKDMTLIALSGWGQDEDKRRSREAGFDHHIVKPVDAGALQKLLDPSQATGSERGVA